ncbi:hypothetical protein C8A00DRAFT_37458 [Chaetomidium leptoderma]|uniref:Uncharacterized protein n=1 Tax=Chaetomidium leptoderma TaxID=669021 RepID=A0AAN6ZTX0_9PEZI|nr:hypothetical protein C8A00DRAFT_37458 [Chaetomidium leptoderma]
MTILSWPVSHQTTPLVQREEKADNTQREYLWNSPDGNSPDFFETYTHGDEILISWNALNNSIYDLWLTSWNYDPDPVALCLAMNLAHDGNLKLVTSDPPTTQLANETQYVLRFKPPTSLGEFVASDPDLSSPGFLLVEPKVHQEEVVSSSTTAASTTATATAATSSPTWFRATPSRGVATSVSDPDESIQDMTPGAAAGLTIGLILFVALLVAMEVWYLMWWRKRRRDATGEDGMQPASDRRRMRRLGKGEGGLFVQVDKVEMTIDDALWMSPELPGDSTWGERLVHELQGSRLKRGHPPGRTLTINSSVIELEAGRR